MKQRMQRLGADGYYLLHNHPSGRPHASPEDLRGTLAFAKKVEGFQGHIIINSGEYAVIEPALTKPQIYQIPDHQETLLTPSIPHDLLNQTIAKPIDVVRLGTQLQAKEGIVTLTYLGSDNRVRAIQEWRDWWQAHQHSFKKRWQSESSKTLSKQGRKTKPASASAPTNSSCAFRADA